MKGGATSILGGYQKDLAQGDKNQSCASLLSSPIVGSPCILKGGGLKS